MKLLRRMLNVMDWFMVLILIDSFLRVGLTDETRWIDWFTATCCIIWLYFGWQVQRMDAKLDRLKRGWA